MTDGEISPYVGLGVIGGLVLICIVGMIIKEVRRRKGQKIPRQETPQQEVILPDEINIDDLNNVEFYKTPEKATLKEATTDAIKLLQAKRNVIRDDIIRDRKKMMLELKRVKQTQVEIYSLIRLLIGYYKDLNEKKEILRVSTAGLMENDNKGK